MTSYSSQFYNSLNVRLYKISFSIHRKIIFKLDGARNMSKAMTKIENFRLYAYLYYIPLTAAEWNKSVEGKRSRRRYFMYICRAMT